MGESAAAGLAALQPEPEHEAPKSQEDRPPTWFWDRLHAIEEHEWGKVYDVLLMRMGESKVAMAPGEKGYLRMFTGPVRLEEIRQKYGGGKFRCILEKNGRYVTSHDFEIEGQPIYDTSRERPDGTAGGTARSNGEGALLQQFVDVLRDELQRSREAGQAPDGTTEKVVEMLSSASEKAMEIVTRQVPTNSNGGGAISQLREAIGLLKELGFVGGAGSSGGGIMETVRVLKELGLIGQPQQNPLEQLKTMFDIYAKLNELRGDEGGDRPRDWKSVAAQGALEILRPVVERAAQQPPRGQAPAPQAPRPSAASTASPAPAGPQRLPVPVAMPPAPSGGPLRTERLSEIPPQQAEVAPEGAAVAPPPPSADLFSEEAPEFRTWVSKRIVWKVRHGDSGESIVDFLSDCGAKKLLTALVENEPSQVTAYLLLDPILKFAVEDPGWDEILKEARDYVLEQADVVGPEGPRASPN